MFISLKSLMVSTILMACLISQAVAYEIDFPPYPAGKFPATCQIHSLKALHESSRRKGNYKSSYQIKDGKTLLTLHLDMSYSKHRFGLYASLKNKAGKALMKAIKTTDHPAFIKKIYWSYLNKDNIKDIIIVTESGDSGLMNGDQQATFLLSHNNQYIAKQLQSFSIGAKDFYDYSTDNKCEYLHQTFIKNGSDHYWVYNVLQFDRGNIIEKNALSRYFPKWIKFTSKANSQAATLSNKRKQQLWQQYLKKTKNLSVAPR